MTPRERSVICSTYEVSLLLREGRGELRRPCGAQPAPWLAHYMEGGCHVEDWRPGQYEDGAWDLFCGHAATSVPGFGRCPFGEPGTRLYVREQWADADCMYQGHTNDCPGVVGYADHTGIQFNASRPRRVPGYDLKRWNWDALQWRSPAIMPRWMSRMTLFVESVDIRRSVDVPAARARGIAPGDLLENPWFWIGEVVVASRCWKAAA